MVRKLNKVEITKKIDAPIEKVWDAFTKKGKLSQWFAPQKMTTHVVEFQLTIGGKYKICMRNNKGVDFCAIGEFTKIDKPTQLQYTWAWESNKKEVSNVAIHLKEIESDTTELHFVHSDLPTEESQSNHNDGWTSALYKLEKLFQ